MRGWRHIPWGDPNVETVEERVLVASNWVEDARGNRQTQRTNNFGHGQIFTAWGTSYLVFHAKRDQDGERWIYFKELSINADGTIDRLHDGHWDRSRDLNWFLAPDCPP